MSALKCGNDPASRGKCNQADSSGGPLWIVDINVGKQGVVSDIPSAQGDVSEEVLITWEVDNVACSQSIRAGWKRRALATADHVADWRFFRPAVVVLSQILWACARGSMGEASRAM